MNIILEFFQRIKNAIDIHFKKWYDINLMNALDDDDDYWSNR